MQIYFDWINLKKYVVLSGMSLLLLGSYTLLSGQSDDNANYYPQFVVMRLASFDFFGEPEIEVIIEDADVRPPVGSDVVINPDDVIDMYEDDVPPKNDELDQTESTSPVVPTVVEPPVEPNPLPSSNESDAVVRATPREDATHSHSVFNDGDRRSTEEKVRGWNKNSGPRPLPDSSENTNIDVANSEISGSKAHEATQRQNPDRVSLISLMPAVVAQEDPDFDYKVIEAPHLDEVAQSTEELLPTQETSPIVINPPPVVISVDHPWGDLPLSDQEFLAQYWQKDLSEGFYIQVFATIQPLKLRSQIGRYEGNLPLIITATHGRLGMMNRLLVGPLKADELGAVGLELRLQGVKDYFLVTVRE